MKIEVLGAGCRKCHALAELAEATLKELGVEGSVEHVSCMGRIVGYGVLSTPALVVNGQVRCTGRVPTTEEMRRWLKW